MLDYLDKKDKIEIAKEEGISVRQLYYVVGNGKKKCKNFSLLCKIRERAERNKRALEGAMV